MAAVVLEGFEALEGRPFEHTWEEIDGDRVIVVKPTEEEPMVSEHMAIVNPPIKPAEAFPPRCPSCGAPRDLSYPEWRDEDGTVMDKCNSVRVNLLDTYTPGVVFRELERELGSEVNPLIINAGEAFMTRRIHDLGPVDADEGSLHARERQSFCEMALASLPLWWKGVAVHLEHEGGKLSVTSYNPYHEYLLAGQAAEGKEAAVVWEPPTPPPSNTWCSPRIDAP
ncbi:MAG: hypothetical protein SWK76_12655 [Actinomycetota bacterium]|nr:hypothetical protein [Actinomycetota bacterium]